MYLDSNISSLNYILLIGSFALFSIYTFFQLIAIAVALLIEQIKSHGANRGRSAPIFIITPILVHFSVRFC